MKKQYKVIMIASIVLILLLLMINNLSHMPKVDNLVYIGDGDNNNSNSSKVNKENHNNEINNLRKQNEAAIEYVKYRKRVDYNQPISSESADYKDNTIIEERYKYPDSITNKEIILNNNVKPKIVIIIDDISNVKQIYDVKSVGMKLTPSVFPNDDKEMIKEVNSLDFFMVHLPLEANKYKDELDTIKTTDSIDRIERKIRNIKENNPNVKYMNNHTGSKFTSDKESMKMLLEILDKNNIDFVDSRTTPHTTLNELSRERDRLILYRDVFIDNDLKEDSLKKQIQEGIKIAQSRGYAILIAHPHKQTLEMLKNIKKNILKDVDVVYLDELDSMLKNKHITRYSQKIEY